MKPRRPIPRQSAKRKQLANGVRYSTITGVRKPVKHKKRKPSEFARIYGSRARVAWVKAQPCVRCGATPCENHHIESDGTGRKANYDKIVPLCSAPRTIRNGGLTIHSVGCHRAVHEMGRVSFEFFTGVNLEAAAADIARQWARTLTGEA